MDVADIPLDDPATYRLLSEGKTLGVFQLESPGMQALLKRVRPTAINDISAVLALYRPGPMDNGSHTEYAKRKHKEVILTSGYSNKLDAVLEKVLQETHGVVVYQEQIMELIKRITGWGYAEAEDIFTAMRKKKFEKMEASKPSFFRDGVAKGFTEADITDVWELIVPFADYSFNKSHSIAYAHISYWTAYLKANHPREYMCSLLTRAADTTEIGKLIKECGVLGIDILPPDINDSGLEFTPTKKGIRYGVASIKGLGDSVTRRIIAGRPYGSIDDFFRKAHFSVLNARVLEALTKSGAFDSLWSSREELMGQISGVASLAIEDRKHRSAGESSILTVRFRPQRAPEGPPRKDSGLRAEWERQTLGIQLTFPVMELALGKPLSEQEWVWLEKILSSQYPSQLVEVIIDGVTVKIPKRSTFSETLSSYLTPLGITVKET